MKQVKVTINNMNDPAGTWEKLSVRNRVVEDMREICKKVVDHVDADVRRMEGQPTLKPGEKSRTTPTVVIDRQPHPKSPSWKEKSRSQ